MRRSYLYVFDRVPAGRLRVTLAADQWEFQRDVDLTNGQDSEVTFALDPIIVRGTIHLGDEARPGEVRFEYAGKTVAEARTNATGEYETKLWQPAMYFAHVTIDGDAAMAFIDPVDIEKSGVFDFTLPDNRVIARVTDEQTGAPIADATIGVHSSAVQPSIGELQLGQRYTTDQKGVVSLPRLRTGQATIEASAQS